MQSNGQVHQEPRNGNAATKDAGRISEAVGAMRADVAVVECGVWVTPSSERLAAFWRGRYLKLVVHSSRFGA